MSGNPTDFDDIEECWIDDEGTFKYIQLHLRCMKTQKEKTIIRGSYVRFHEQLQEKFKNVELAEYWQTHSNDDLRIGCLGGGRIQHNESDNRLLIYGYSFHFGRADHDLTK